jgi:phosphoglycerate dehydrogenase-like enzyme
MSLTVLSLRPRADFERADALPPSSIDVIYRSPADADLSAVIRQADALIMPAVGPPVPAPLFDGTRLRLVQVTGAGLDRLNRAALEAAGIPVANVPGGSNRAVAEHAVTTAAILMRRFAWADAEIKQGNYVAFRARMLADNLGGLDGLLAGVVGLGTIGVAVATAFRHMGCRICFHDPAPRDDEAARSLGAESMPLDRLLQDSDIVTLHVPLLPATKGLIGHRELGLMKPGSVLIQASRGGIVDEGALALALERGHLGGASVDVYGTEPPPSDHPLLALRGDAARRLLLTPHIAGVTRQSATFLCRSAWQNIVRVLVDGAPPQHRAY